MSEKSVDRHFFLKRDLDESLLQILATLQETNEIVGLNISRLLNILIMKGINELNEMEFDEAFKTIFDLNEEFREL